MSVFGTIISYILAAVIGVLLWSGLFTYINCMKKTCGNQTVRDCVLNKLAFWKCENSTACPGGPAQWDDAQKLFILKIFTGGADVIVTKFKCIDPVTTANSIASEVRNRISNQFNFYDVLNVLLEDVENIIEHHGLPTGTMTIDPITQAIEQAFFEAQQKYCQTTSTDSSQT